MQVCECMSM
uniref:Uncharacterized protein n=1 Tax=Anguilla anguilla TaxID=7936 RepID=A0A0E9Q6P8_ANGAN